jgi:4-carboxymuconolactone decarboxylase
MRLALDQMERLRRLAINDARDMELGGGGEVDAPRLDSKTLELVRIAALVAVGSAVPSYGA